MTFKNEIKKEYINGKNNLKTSFPEAFEFLKIIESLSNKGFHIGTHKNLHLYFKDTFLFYFKMDSYGVVEYSAKCNGITKRQTQKHPDMFFTPWLQRLDELGIDSLKEIDINPLKKNNRASNYNKVIITRSIESQRIFDSVIEILNLISQ